MTKIPTLATFTETALKGEYTKEDIADISNLITAKLAKLKKEEAEYKQLQKLIKIVETTLSNSVDNEDIYNASKIVDINNKDYEPEEESTKVM